MVSVAGHWLGNRYLRPFSTGAEGLFSSSVSPCLPIACGLRMWLEDWLIALLVVVAVHSKLSHGPANHLCEHGVAWVRERCEHISSSSSRPPPAGCGSCSAAAGQQPSRRIACLRTHVEKSKPVALRDRSRCPAGLRTLSDRPRRSRVRLVSGAD